MANQTKREDDASERHDGDKRPERHEGRLRDFARRVLQERPSRERDSDDDGEREGYVPLEVAKDAMASILETGDRAKTEMVRMVAREVRTYLDELQLVEGVEHMLRHYTLEVHASLSLEPKGGDAPDDSKVTVETKRKTKAEQEPKPEEPADEPDERTED